jgi:hypothetical protein
MLLMVSGTDWIFVRVYEPPPDDLPGKFKKKRPYLVAKAISLAPAKGVQCEA